MTTSNPTTLSLLLPAVALSLAPVASVHAQADEEGDGAPHVAVAQEADGSLELEFEVEAGLDLSGPVPIITLDVSQTFDAFNGGFATLPLNDTPLPNDDLGFVSELEGSGEEGGTLDANIEVRLLSKDDNFAAFFGGEEILASAGDAFTLGAAFDTHPIWLLESEDAGFLGTSTASLEVFDTLSNASLGTFDLTLSTIPEPASAALLAAGGALLLRRRRATA